MNFFSVDANLKGTANLTISSCDKTIADSPLKDVGDLIFKGEGAYTTFANDWLKNEDEDCHPTCG